ncbi:MAG TPA: hypothetical protein VII58_02735 [Acidobacteriaceae bacterium]
MCPVCFAVALLLLLLTAAPVVAQMPMPPSKTAQQTPQSHKGQPSGQLMDGMGDMDMGDMPGMTMPMPSDPAAKLLMGESSGTSVQPSGWAMPMVMTGVGKGAGKWQLAWMAQAFITEVQESHETTPPGEIHRGGNGLNSTNWGMLSAQHPLAGGVVQLRAMLSLEPATITARRYPELFQFGETAFGQPVEDGQHPHNLVMEIGAQYAHRVGEGSVANFYYAPVGDPALGPTAYPHRASAAELPQATLAHHYEDSTHIADNVATAELAWSKLHVEASGFHGREPGENRWTVGSGAMDSWSARVTWLPAKNWAAQISTGRLHHPEALEAGDEERTTASVEYANGERAASVIWGRDYKTGGHYAVNAVTVEGVTPVGRRNYITGRVEWSQRDELFAGDPVLAATLPRWIDVTAFTGGYTRELSRWRDAALGLGVNATAYRVDDLSAISSVYGTRPWAVSLYLRVRLKKPATAHTTMH